MGKWNNAGYLLSDEIVGLVHNLMADYQNCDFATFRSRLLELVNGQSRIKDIINETTPYFQELQEDISDIKDSYEQLASAYQEDKYPSVILSEDELARLAETIIQRIDEGVKNDSLEGISSKIKELTEKKEPLPVKTETPNYSQKINQLLTVVNNIQQQNREMAEKLEELQKQKEAEPLSDSEEDEVTRIQEDNKSLLQALNKYKAAYISLKNERNDLAMQLDKLKKENFLRIRRKELQDALLEQKESEIAKLEEALAGYKNQAVSQNGSGLSGISAASRLHGKDSSHAAEKNSQAGTPEKSAIPHSNFTEKIRAAETPAKEEGQNAAPAHKSPSAPPPDKKETADKTQETSQAQAEQKGAAPSTEKGTSRPPAKTKTSRPAAKAETSRQPKEETSAPEKPSGSTGIERAKKR